LEDGDIVSLGPHKLQVIYTPGHASDGIVLYSNNEKFIISSDILWENDMAVMTLRIEGSTALFRMLDSLKKIENLDVKTVYPGHGKPFTDFKVALSRSKARINKFLEDRDALGNDLLKKITVYTLLMKSSIFEKDLFPYLMGTYWFKETVDLYFNSEYEFKYNEIINKLIERGAVKRESENLLSTVKP
jgi:glyoxylase-like metal-dependent hydrolase (beta-lactamase superfamily II)